ncbi:MAG: response regulator [Leptolyngbyaceae cyanobacterium]
MVDVQAAKILLVEDDPNDLELIRLAFDEHNFVNHMDIAEDGEQALTYLHGNEDHPPQPLPKLVLLDLRLPRVDGIEVLQRIRQHPRTQQMIVVIMTSSAEDQDLRACYALGANSYIVKPLDFQQFIDVSRQIGFYWMMLNQIPEPLS